MDFSWVNGIRCWIVDSSVSAVNGKSVASEQGVIFKDGGKGDSNTVVGGNVYLDPAATFRTLPLNRVLSTQVAVQ